MSWLSIELTKLETGSDVEVPVKVGTSPLVRVDKNEDSGSSDAVLTPDAWLTAGGLILIENPGTELGTLETKLPTALLPLESSPVSVGLCVGNEMADVSVLLPNTPVLLSETLSMVDISDSMELRVEATLPIMFDV
jgi:hypothetical protein